MGTTTGVPAPSSDGTPTTTFQGWYSVSGNSNTPLIMANTGSSAPWIDDGRKHNTNTDDLIMHAGNGEVFFGCGHFSLDRSGRWLHFDRRCAHYLYCS
jgi:hypothetical protein